MHRVEKAEICAIVNPLQRALTFGLLQNLVDYGLASDSEAGCADRGVFEISDEGWEFHCKFVEMVTARFGGTPRGV